MVTRRPGFHLSLSVLLSLWLLPAKWKAMPDCTNFQWTSDGPGNQLEALQEFYTVTQGQYWTGQYGWNTSQTSNAQSPCSWQGLECCNTSAVTTGDGPACVYNGSVQYVTLAHNNLKGTIPDVFWDQLGCTLSEINLAGKDTRSSGFACPGLDTLDSNALEYIG